MGRIVILAEKPSVGRDIARVLGATAARRVPTTGTATPLPGRWAIW